MGEWGDRLQYKCHYTYIILYTLHITYVYLLRIVFLQVSKMQNSRYLENDMFFKKSQMGRGSREK